MYALSVKLKCFRGPQSCGRWISIKLSVKLKSNRGLQSHSWWISIFKLSVELKCYRGLQSRSGWKNKVYLWFLYTVYYVNYVNCRTEVAGFWVVFQLRGILKFTWVSELHFYGIVWSWCIIVLNLFSSIMDLDCVLVMNKTSWFLAWLMTHTCILDEMEIRTARTIVMAMTTFPKHQQAIQYQDMRLCKSWSSWLEWWCNIWSFW